MTPGAVTTKLYPVTLTGGIPQPITLAPPLQGFGTQSWVVVKNITPWPAQISGVGTTGQSSISLPPGMSDLVSFGGVRGSLVVSFLLSSPLTPTAYIIADFYQGSTRPTGTYPAVAMPIAKTLGSLGAIGAGKLFYAFKKEGGVLLAPIADTIYRIWVLGAYINATSAPPKTLEFVFYQTSGQIIDVIMAPYRTSNTCAGLQVTQLNTTVLGTGTDTTAILFVIYSKT